MMEILQNSTDLWVAISSVVFVLAVLKFGAKPILGALDAKIETIKAEIATAEQLRTEAQAMLGEFEARQRDAQAEAARIIEQAKNNAIALQQAAEAELAESMARREAQLSERLKRVEEKAIADIQNHAAELSIQATREIVTKTMDEKTGARLIDQAVQSLAKHLN